MAEQIELPLNGHAPVLTPAHAEPLATIYAGDCLAVMAELPAGSIAAIVTDPPYGLEFMGKEWDKLDAGLAQENVWKGRRGHGGAHIGEDDTRPGSRHHVALGAARHRFQRCTLCGKRAFSGSPCECPEPTWIYETPEGPPSGMIRMERWHHAWALAAYRVLKPGGHLLAFGGTRTFHRLACALEDAGFEIRDCLMWLYGSGFPKSLDVSKAIDRAAGLLAPEGRGFTVAGVEPRATPMLTIAPSRGYIPPPAVTESAKTWQGWGTALKPAFEPILWATKPQAGRPLAIEAATVRGLLCEVVSFAETDTPLSALLRECGVLSIESSLKQCLVALSSQTSKFTTATAYALTTDLRILKSSLLELTRAFTIQASNPSAGTASAALVAVGLSASVLAKCERLAATTAGDLAIGAYADEVDDREANAPLSPDWCPIILARKPLGERTVAANVLTHGTGALNVDGCRIAGQPRLTGTRDPHASAGSGNVYTGSNGARQIAYDADPPSGRWPANVLLDEAAAARLDAQSGETQGSGPYVQPRPTTDANGASWSKGEHRPFHIGDTGGASRFFYTSKADADDRDGSTHPTVKPVDLMKWLITLVTPPGGIVLDPFLGSGTTVYAARALGVRSIGIEREAEYVAAAIWRLRQGVLL